MPDSPASQTPYEVLGVDPSASQEELRRAYRRLLRVTHPDTGGSATRFHSVQVAWERIGDPRDRATYDRGSFARSADDTPTPPGSASTSGAAQRPHSTGSSLKARTHGHPGGQARERFLSLLREWVGRGIAIDDPYDASLVRSAPREIRYQLAKALAEEQTAKIVAPLGIGYTIWNDVLAGRHGEKLDHIVLGPAGLFAIRSEDWGSTVQLLKGEITGAAIGADDEPLRDLWHAARSFSRELGVRFTGIVIVVPDDDLAEPFMQVARGRLAGAVLIRRSLLPQLLRNGTSGGERTSVDRVFELRTRLQNGIRFV
jgi:molecular chaperone DnaJ